MTTLKLQNQYSWLQSDNKELKDLLWSSLRFREKGYVFSPAWKSRKWDGFVDFFTRDAGRFLTGLLPEVELVLKYKNEPYQVVDERGRFPFAIQNIDDQFLNQWLSPGRPNFTLHDYQVDFINEISRVQRGIVRAPTSAGKSAILIGSLKCLPPKTPTLVVTKSTDLCHQIYEDIASWNFDNLGKCIGSKKKDFCPNLITVANVDSLHKIEKLLGLMRAIFFDEIHVCMSKVPKEAIKQMTKASVRVAISATPFKYSGSDQTQKYSVKGFFGPVIKPGGKDLSTTDLQARGILSSSKCVFFNIDEPQLPYETYQDAVTLGIAESLHFNNIVAKLAKKLKGRTLIIVERIAQGEMLHTLIKGSHWIYGEDTKDDRDKVINLLKNSKKCVCIVQQKLISAGINVFIHGLINAAGGAASHQTIQILGRGLRLAEDKETFTYYDFIFNISDFLFMHSNKRIKTLKEEGHQVIIDEIKF